MLTVTNNSGNIKNTKDSDINTVVIFLLRPSAEDVLLVNGRNCDIPFSQNLGHDPVISMSKGAVDAGGFG